MNIFIMVLAFLFMAGYYLMDSPSQTIKEHNIEYAINQSDLRAIAECTAGAHTAAIKEEIFDDICIDEYEIDSRFICLNNRSNIIKCEITKNKKPEFSFILTTSAIIADDYFNDMLEVLEKYYSNAGTFGIFMDDFILTGGEGGKRIVPTSIIKNTKLQPGQLIYLTQYEIPDIKTEFALPTGSDIKCAAGTIKTYRFAKWQCTPVNEKTNCPGDTVWDFDTNACAADISRRPLCGSKQTAVLVDDVWQCMDPFLEKNCPTGTIAYLNYDNLEWECIDNPGAKEKQKKCTGSGTFFTGGGGATIRVPTSYCTDCEEMITNTETCAATCVPSSAKLSDSKCYPKGGDCTGVSRAFYFGFPSASYATRVSEINGKTIPIDASHSQNRKFNCLDCGAGIIDTEKSAPPFIAICK